MDYLPHVSAMCHHHYSLREEWFAYLDGLWNPHTVDSLASVDNRPQLGAPHAGRFCSVGVGRRDVRGAVPLGPPARVLDASARDLPILAGGPMIAIRFDRS